MNRLVTGPGDRGALIAGTILVGSIAGLTVGVADGAQMRTAAPAVLGLVGLISIYRVAPAKLRPTWINLLVLITLVIMWIPIRRYEVPGHLPFQLEPYRLLVALVTLGWVLSLLVDRRVRWRSTFLDWPLIFVVLVAIISVIINGSRVNSLGVGSVVAKSLTFLMSYLLVFYIMASVVRKRSDVETLLRAVVGGAAVVAGLGLVEFRTGFNVFNHLSTVFPFLRLQDILTTSDISRGGRLRIYGSAQHPIALSAVLVMILPLAFYLARSTNQRRWWIALILMVAAVFATVSRTGIVMLAILVVTLVVLRASEVKRLWPAVIPMLLAIHFVAPGAVGSLADAFFPQGGLVKQQEVDAGGSGSGRVADLGPGFNLFLNRPVLGEGFGTRVVDGPTPNALIYDNEWLDTLVETGAIGVAIWIWVFLRFVRRLGLEARRDKTDRGLLAGCLAGSTAAFAFGMFTFDAFSFIQCTLVLFMLFALGNALVSNHQNTWSKALSR